jgi:hypothetical protein
MPEPQTAYAPPQETSQYLYTLPPHTNTPAIPQSPPTSASPPSRHFRQQNRINLTRREVLDHGCEFRQVGEDIWNCEDHFLVENTRYVAVIVNEDVPVM